MPLHFSTAWHIAVASRYAVIDCAVDVCAENRISTTRGSLNSGGVTQNRARLRRDQLQRHTRQHYVRFFYTFPLYFFKFDLWLKAIIKPSSSSFEEWLQAYPARRASFLADCYRESALQFIHLTG